MDSQPQSPPDLFEREKTVLERAMRVHGDPSPAVVHFALAELIAEYERVIRDMRRVISHSDRTELELNIANQRLRELTEALTFQNRHDGLTRLLNRNTLIFETERLLKQAPVALILLDIDHFKQVNDRYGHPTGDKVLTGLATALNHLVKTPSFCGRLGGEEFAAVIPTEHIREAIVIAEHLSSHIRDLRCAPEAGLRITASLSVTVAQAGVSFEKLYVCGDDALYRAKHNGRDRIEIVWRLLETT
ncbi:MAG: GGDEF domain-containing protein [Halothiobacillus sp.]